MKNKIPYKEPEFELEAFNCPFCSAYSNQHWFGLKAINGTFLENTRICVCSHCNMYSIWHEEKMIYPDFSGIEPPNDDLSDDIKNDYTEAASIIQKSPRGSTALLRLIIQKLCVQLGEQGKNLNSDIGNLVKRGLPAKVQESLDALRVIGNESVHPGTLDLKDDIGTATALFRLVNFIAEKMITEPKEIDAIYSKIPEGKRQQIKLRDKNKP
jgi:hypothetical protein